MFYLYFGTLNRMHKDTPTEGKRGFICIAARDPTGPVPPSFFRTCGPHVSEFRPDSPFLKTEMEPLSPFCCLSCSPGNKNEIKDVHSKHDTAAQHQPCQARQRTRPKRQDTLVLEDARCAHEAVPVLLSRVDGLHAGYPQKWLG